MGLNLKELVSEGFNYQNVKILKNVKELPTKGSHFGTSIWGDITISPFSYRTGTSKMMAVSGIHIPCVIVEASGSKKIVKTEIQGLNTRGTVKEYINHGDVVISIKGVLANKNIDNDKYPKLEMEALMQIIEAPVSIKIIQNFLNNFLKVHNIVIESYNFPAKQGMQNIQLFELNCVSDEPIELINK